MKPGQRPLAGFRLVVTRSGESAVSAVYEGALHLPNGDVSVRATVAVPGGAVEAKLGDGGTAALEKQVAALVRAATRAGVESGDLPRKIARWRG